MQFSFTFIALFAIVACTASVFAASTPNTNLEFLESRAVKCKTSSSCARGKYCHKARCVSQLDESESCDKNAACFSGLCTSQGECAADNVKNIANGDRCIKSSQCDSKFCHNAKCSAPLPAGSPCTKDQGCTAGICPRNGSNDLLGVIGTDNICPVTPYILQLFGARCRKSSQCVTGYCNKLRCDTPGLVGATCYKNQGCASGNCDLASGKCKNLIPGIPL